MKSLLVSSQTVESGQRPRFVGLLLVALLMSALWEGIPTVLSKFLVPLASTSFGFERYQLLFVSIFSYTSFLVNPVFLFVVFYRLGRKIDLTENYASVAIYIFIGGLLGGSVSFFLMPVLLGGSWGAAFPDILSVVTTVTSFSVLLVRSGLDILFPAFVAIAFANLRSGRLSAAPRRQNVTGGNE
ncbi:MAG: hypothetical protein LYZ69_07685 [Nitrososphaerales archaeon]|nr:hypothetical protein [Nitrososphaerales archaeon]